MDKAKQLHNDLIEAIAENDETLMERYFEKGTLDETDMQKGLLISIRDHGLFPMFCISAKAQYGQRRVMGFIDYCCPSAAHMNPEKLTNGADLPCIHPTARWHSYSRPWVNPIWVI